MTIGELKAALAGMPDEARAMFYYDVNDWESCTLTRFLELTLNNHGDDPPTVDLIIGNVPVGEGRYITATPDECREANENLS